MIEQVHQFELIKSWLLVQKRSMHVISDITHRYYIVLKDVKLIGDNQPDQVGIKLGLK